MKKTDQKNRKTKSPKSFFHRGVAHPFLSGFADPIPIFHA
jgi:hypothetical protein